MANTSKHLSPAGWNALRHREHAVLHYYNDIANNCTFGVGTLAHHGSCTDEELRRRVTAADVNTQLNAHVRTVEAAVRRQVHDHELTQEQFDALVSFTYNTGSHGASSTLAAANRGNDTEVARHMAQHVYVHPRDAHGRRLPAIRIPGLATRRGEEAAPFRNQRHQ
jgi:lysozyme